MVWDRHDTVLIRLGAECTQRKNIRRAKPGYDSYYTALISILISTINISTLEIKATKNFG